MTLATAHAHAPLPWHPDAVSTAARSHISSAHSRCCDRVESRSRATLLVVDQPQAKEGFAGKHGARSLPFCSAAASGLAPCSRRTPDLTFVTSICEVPSSSMIASHATHTKTRNRDVFSTVHTHKRQALVIGSHNYFLVSYVDPEKKNYILASTCHEPKGLVTGCNSARCLDTQVLRVTCETGRPTACQRARRNAASQAGQARML